MLSLTTRAKVFAVDRVVVEMRRFDGRRELDLEDFEGLRIGLERRLLKAKFIGRKAKSLGDARLVDRRYEFRGSGSDFPGQGSAADEHPEYKHVDAAQVRHAAKLRREVEWNQSILTPAGVGHQLMNCRWLKLLKRNRSFGLRRWSLHFPAQSMQLANFICEPVEERHGGRTEIAVTFRRHYCAR